MRMGAGWWDLHAGSREEPRGRPVSWMQVITHPPFSIRIPVLFTANSFLTFYLFPQMEGFLFSQTDFIKRKCSLFFF